jgi:outer membrane protein assembly factor BamD
MPFMLRFLLVLSALCVGSQSVHAATEALTPEARYALGQKYMKRGYYQKAMEHFSVLRNSHRDNAFAVKAELAIADVYYKQGEYDLARVAYEDFTRLHPRNADLDYAVFRLGLSYYRKASKVAARDQTWTQQAVHSWANFDQRFPESEYGSDVQQAVAQGRNRLALKELRVARFYANRRAWPAVVARLQPLLRRYPKSEDAPEAMGLLALALVNTDAVEQAKEMATRLASDHSESAALQKLRNQAPQLFE